jgi:hypothetical protein
VVIADSRHADYTRDMIEKIAPGTLKWNNRHYGRDVKSGKVLQLTVMQDKMLVAPDRYVGFPPEDTEYYWDHASIERALYLCIAGSRR